MRFNIDENYLTQTLINLVRINSCNPTLSPGAPGELEISQYVAKALEEIGLDVHLHEPGPGRINVVGIYKGDDPDHAKSLMWNAHMDTVGVEGMPEPFSAEVRGGRLYGRGSQDMKASLAAMLAAAKALSEAQVRLKGSLIFTAVADEEYTSLGTEDLVKHYHADAAIVTEPTDLTLGRAHRGFIIYKVETFGKAAHGSRYQEGIDAIMRMGRVLSQLDRLELDLRNRTAHPLVGPPSLHTGLIHGGTEVSVYAAECELYIERRTIPGETTEQATEEIQTILDHLAEQDPNFNAKLKVELVRSPLEIDPQSEIVQIVDAVIQSRLGIQTVHSGASFWTDAALLADAGIESVLLGPIGAGLHSAEEWVDIGSVIDLAEILAQIAVRYCEVSS